MPKRGTITSVVVVAKERHPGSESVARKLIGGLVEKGFSVLSVYPLKHKAADTLKEIGELRRRPDLLITVGGDGTILRTLRILGNSIPVLGVNVGGRGILAEVLPEQFDSALEKVSTGSYFLENRMRIACSIDRRILPPALNEVYVSRAQPVKTPTFSIRLRGGVTLNQRMDGLIISTPTGSTGHSMSFGAPVLSASMEAFVIMCVAPLSKIPPLVVPPDPILTTCNTETNVIIDGQEVFKAGRNAKITVRRYKSRAVFMRFNRRELRQLYNLGFR